MSDSPPQRIEKILSELSTLIERLRAGSVADRRAAYAACVPLLGEIDRLNAFPLPVRELNALTREAGWHLRSLAGLVTPAKLNTDEQHASWAQDSLGQIARCVGLGKVATASRSRGRKPAS